MNKIINLPFKTVFMLCSFCFKKNCLMELVRFFKMSHYIYLICDLEKWWSTLANNFKFWKDVKQTRSLTYSLTSSREKWISKVVLLNELTNTFINVLPQSTTKYIKYYKVNKVLLDEVQYIRVLDKLRQFF